MSRLSEGIEKKLNDKFYHKYTDMQGRKCEQLSINKERIKDVSKAIAEKIRIDTEEVKKMLWTLFPLSYGDDGEFQLMEENSFIIDGNKIAKAINKDCIVIGGQK